MRRWGVMGALLLALFFMSACEDGGHFLFDDLYESYDEEAAQTRYPVFFESELMQLAMYELAEGSFFGMYTDVLPGFDGRIIAAHESALGVNHAAFMEVMHLGDDFPLMWVLECIAEHKMPVIVILPPEVGGPFGNHWEAMLTETAIAFGQLPVPMFVVFYPVSHNPPWDGDTYIAFFRYARALFATHAPKVAFVWAVDGDVHNFNDYFPGNLAADWAGLSLFTTPDALSDGDDMLAHVMDFYQAFQRDMPIMLNLGISHFSTEDHRYLIAETAVVLEQIYTTIQRDFPRVKMVNYMDISRLGYNGRDYRISADAALRYAYWNGTQGFVSEVPRAFDDGFVTQPIKSAYSAYVEAGRVYLDVRIVTDELGISFPPFSGQTRWVDGARRVDAALLGIHAAVDGGHVWVR